MGRLFRSHIYWVAYRDPPVPDARGDLSVQAAVRGRSGLDDVQFIFLRSQLLEDLLDSFVAAISIGSLVLMRSQGCF